MKTSKTFQYLALASLLAGASACSTWHKLNDTEKGAVIGGGSGAAVGTAVTGGSAGGALVGGALGAVGGGLIGNEVQKDDRRHR